MTRPPIIPYALVAVCAGFLRCTPNTDNTVTPVPAPTRAEVISAYNREFGSASAYTWNGSVNNCQAGTMPQTVRNRVVQRIEYYRQLVGLTNSIALHSGLDSLAQKAALMMQANGQISDSPPNSWQCFSLDGYNGCINSLKLGNGLKAEALIDWFMQSPEPTDINTYARGQLLFSRAKTFGYGATTQYAALYALHNSSNPAPATTPEYIAYPPKGFVMWELVRNTSKWSFAKPGATVGLGSKVTMQDANGAPVPLAIIGQGYGSDNQIVWQPTINIANLAADTRYRVTVSDVKVNGVQSSFTYDVTLVKQ